MKRRLIALAAMTLASFAYPSAVAEDVPWEFKRKFIGIASALGFSIDSGEAHAYFKGQNYQQTCFARGDMIGCSVTGPMNMLFAYDQQSEYYEMKAGQIGFCYAGREGVFCDIYY